MLARVHSTNLRFRASHMKVDYSGRKDWAERYIRRKDNGKIELAEKYYIVEVVGNI